MVTLIVARGVQGWAGGLVSGGGTALIASLYDARLRTRILAITQGTFTAAIWAGRWWAASSRRSIGGAAHSG